MAVKPAATPAKSGRKAPEVEVTVVMQEIRNIDAKRTETVGPPRTVKLPATTYDRYNQKDENDRSIFDGLPDKIISVDDPRKKKTK